MLILRDPFLNRLANRQHSGPGAPPVYTINITNYTAIKNTLVQITGILLMDCHRSWHLHFWLATDVWFITLSWICKWVTQTKATIYCFHQCYIALYDDYHNSSPSSPLSLGADSSEVPVEWSHFARSDANVQITDIH